MVVELAGGFAVVGAGAWLFGRAQPAAVRGALSRRSLRGFICPDRAALSRGELAETASRAEFAEKKPHAESAEFAEMNRTRRTQRRGRGQTRRPGVADAAAAG